MADKVIEYDILKVMASVRRFSGILDNEFSKIKGSLTGEEFIVTDTLKATIREQIIKEINGVT